MNQFSAKIQEQVALIQTDAPAELDAASEAICRYFEQGEMPDEIVGEIGGMMTHGSVVAREYGIPAVVGVNLVTTRLKTGQHIRVDGSLGRVQLLE